MPPIAAELWLVASDHGDLKGERGEVSCDVVAGKTAALTIEFPR